MSSAQRSYRVALLLIIVSSVGFSLNGLIIRSLEEANSWQVLFWRGLGVAVSQGAYLLWMNRGRVIAKLRGIGRLGVIAALINGASPAGFFFALSNTTVANVVFLLSAMPFVSAILGRVVLGERLRRETLIAIPIAALGILVMVGGSIAAGAWLGNLLALTTVVAFSVFVIILRYQKGRDMQPVLVLGGIVAMLIATLATLGNVAPSFHDVLLCLILGCVITGAGHLMFMRAAQVLPAAEITFLMLIEFVLAPVWVWIFISEVPRSSTLIGGAIVLASVAAWALWRLRGESAAP